MHFSVKRSKNIILFQLAMAGDGIGDSKSLIYLCMDFALSA